MKTKLVFVLAVLGLKGFSQESARQIKKINQVWGGYYNSIIINEKWSVNSDIQFRTKDWLDHPSQALIRTGLVRKVNEKLNVTVGLAHFRFYLSDVTTRGEWRPWQEIALTENYKKLKAVQRLRIEERFNQKTKSNDGLFCHFQLRDRIRNHTLNGMCKTGLQRNQRDRRQFLHIF